MEQHPHDPNHTFDAPLRVGLLGCGTVGSEVARLLCERGVPGLVLERVAVRDLDKERSVSLPAGRLTNDALAIVKDPTIDVVVEVIGGIDPAYGLLRQALAEHKHVVTANKLLLAHHGVTLRRTAAERGLRLLYEGAACAAIPIIRTLRTVSSAERISSIAAVLNGTTNFVLSEMERGSSFDGAVAEAQRVGYAEADPADDIDGVDAACKLSLLCSLAFGVDLPLGDIAYRGISDVSTERVIRARSAGRRVKLVAEAHIGGDGIVDAKVAPVELDRDHPLARLEDADNGVVLTTDHSGTISLFGPGAGGRPTAAAVIADLEEIAREHATKKLAGAIGTERRAIQ